MHSFASQDAYFALSATRYSKHAIKPLLGDPQIPNTKTRLWCRQIVREKFLLACWENTSVQINQPTPPNPDKLGRAGNYVTDTAADLQTLIRLLLLGKWNKWETDCFFVFLLPLFILSHQDRSDYKRRLLRHCLLRQNTYINVAETCFGYLGVLQKAGCSLLKRSFSLVLNQNNMWHKVNEFGEQMKSGNWFKDRGLG